MIRIYNKDGSITEMTEYEYYCQKYGQEEVEKWINGVEMSSLYWVMDIFSNDSFNGNEEWNKHRDKDLNILEMILQETPSGLYPSVTFGTCPSASCRDVIGHLTGKIYGNVDIVIFLIQYKISDLKEWLLKNHTFTETEKRLLHYDFGEN